MSVTRWGGHLPDGVYAYELRAISRMPEEPLVQSGHLWVQGGSFVTKAPAQPGPKSQSASTSKPPSSITANTTVPDDLIVEGHACIGSGCVDAAGPPLKIKEFGNYQIKFDALNCCVPWERQWALQANEPTSTGDFLIRDLTQGTIPFRITGSAPDNALTILYNGSVGLGTLTPSKKLHVLGSNGTTQGLIEETNGTTALRTMLELKNNGASRLNITDSSVSTTWGINNNTGNLNMIKSGAGVTAFALQGNGNLTIAGILTQGSDRDTKRDIVPVQPEEILAKVASLPIATWNRKTDPTSVRHMGPMAQDFAATFGLGEDDKHIATLDVDGVSLASIQALYRMSTAKDAEIAELRRENTDLAQRLAALEALVLESGRRNDAASVAQPTP